MDIDVETAQVALGMGKIIRGDMCNDEATSIDRLSNTVRDLKEAENKTSGDGRGEHCWQEKLGWVRLEDSEYDQCFLFISEVEGCAVSSKNRSFMPYLYI